MDHEWCETDEANLLIFLVKHMIGASELAVLIIEKDE